MLFKSKIASILKNSVNPNVTLRNSLYKNECKFTNNFLSTTCTSLRGWALEEDVEKHEVPSRYPDVPISNKPYFDFVWENREKHFNKTAMVSLYLSTIVTFYFNMRYHEVLYYIY